MKVFKFTLLLITGLLFFQCSSTSTEDVTSVEAFSAYLNENDEVVAFGKASLESILKKSDYKNLETVGGIIDALVKEAGKGIDINEQVYYAVSGPMNSKGEFNDLEIFIPLKDKKEFRKYLESSLDFEVTEGRDFWMAADENMAIAIQEKLAVMKLSEEIDNPEAELYAIMTKSLGDQSEGEVKEVIETSGDVVFAINAENTVKNVPDFNDLSDSQKQKLSEYAKDGYSKTVLNFESGKAIVNFSNAFNDELMSSMPLKADNSAPILAKLGSGKPRMGVSINMDFSKMNSLMSEVGMEGLDAIFNELLPELEKTFGFSTNIANNASFSLKPSKLMSGEFGLVLFGDPDANGDFDPDYNTHIGLNDNGGLLSSLLNRAVEAMSSGGQRKNGGLSYSSSSEFNTAEPLALPSGASNFGKSGISFFFDLEGFPESTFDNLQGEKELQAVLKVAKFISFEYDNNGGSLQITAKDGKENILKQAMQSIVEEQMNAQMNVNF